jgi:hypothetical protein
MGNITSWCAAHRGLAAAGADVICAQEARIHVDDVEAAKAAARASGTELTVGTPNADGVHLLAFAARAGVHLRSPAVGRIPERYADRLQYAAIYLGHRQVIHVAQIYGHADGDGRAIEENAQLVLAAAVFLRSLGDVPAFIVGDLNMVLAETGVEAPLAMAGWTDILASAGPTCLPSQGAPSRIDYILASRPARALIRGARLHWDLGLAWHAALVIDLEASPPEQAWMKAPALRLDGPQAEEWPAARAAATAAVVAKHSAAVAAAAAAGDAEAMWAAIEPASRQWLSWRRGLVEMPARVVAGRQWRAERPRTTGGGGEAEQKEVDCALLRLRQLRSFRHAAKVHWEGVLGCLPHPAACILAALRRDALGDAIWTEKLQHLGQRPVDVLPGLIVKAEEEYTAHAAECRAKRRHRWQQWVDSALADGSGRVYRWIKGSGGCAAALVPDPAAQQDSQDADAAPSTKSWLLALRGGPAAQLRHLEKHWVPLWRRETPADLPEEWLAELDGLPPFPARVPWTTGIVRSLLRRMPRRKAVGLDGWSVPELRLLPDEILAWMAEMPEVVGRTGRWPEDLRCPEAA